jgi:hypothetical protein
MTLRIAPLITGAAPYDVPLEPTRASPPGNTVERAPPSSADLTLDRVLRAKPELVERLPAFLEGANSKLLYIVAHRALAEGLGALSVRVGETDVIRRNADGSISLDGLTLNDAHGDLARILDARPANYGAHTSVEQLLNESVHYYYANLRYDGGGAAPNVRGLDRFTYATIQQVLVSPDPSQRGIECLAAAAVHLYKSMGLVPPGLSREEFEHRYTSIHGDVGATPRLGHEFDKTLRGIPSERRLDASATAAFANQLRHDDWAKLTGAARGPYVVKELKNVDAVVSHFAQGGAGVRTTWADGGHYFVLTGARREAGEVVVNQDDSLRTSPARRKSPEQEPYATPYDPQLHTRFWTLSRP